MSEFFAKIETENLNPILSDETISFHYGKHHVGYANTLNTLIKNTEFENLSLEEIISKSRNENQKIFNNASQLFNHDFYWKCLKPSVEMPHGKFSDLIKKQFGSLAEFQEKYIAFASTMFGSGWSWVIFKDGKLDFVNTKNSEIPHEDNLKLICVVDLWEHAYYIDYRNDRGRYLNEIIKNCINWEYCASNFE